ncbi:hypothetical protein X737_24140 [Mesorhizobium sp. L48C026A00]|nr:hypothetical protein X737_24140 [Mesorhizobium sp. L48C026A00]
MADSWMRSLVEIYFRPRRSRDTDGVDQFARLSAPQRGKTKNSPSFG